MTYSQKLHILPRMALRYPRCQTLTFGLQAAVSGLVAKVRLAVAISPLLEEAFRIMPRTLTLPAGLVSHSSWIEFNTLPARLALILCESLPAVIVCACLIIPVGSPVPGRCWVFAAVGPFQAKQQYQSIPILQIHA